MDTLKAFAQNEALRETVRLYFIQSLQDEILTQAYAEKDTLAYVKALKIIDKSFNKLEGEYGIKKQSNQDPR